MKIVKAIKEGRYQERKSSKANDEKNKSLSYNPPAEYLLTPEEQAAMEGKHPSLVLVLFITPLLYCPYFTLLLYRPYLDPFTLT